MQVNDTDLPGVKVIWPSVYRDARGYFLETWHAQRYLDALGVTDVFVQHNQSCSVRGVLRGLHFQRRAGQGKLIRVVCGRIWDVVVDLRANSSTFGRWMGVELSGIALNEPQREHKQLWIPPGFAHGFVALSSQAVVEYLCTGFYAPADEFCLRWDDVDLAITWPLTPDVLSPRDSDGHSLAQLQEAGLLPLAGSRE